ncbi:MAG: hypothetical protein QOH68_14 [Nocardioidaceae bacterium]|jgi:type VI protein secretion system component VasK|nr:hypothetical protein [Nocardioidaceae bacterium]
MVTIRYPVTSAAADTIHAAGHLIRVIITRVAVLTAVCLAVAAAAGIFDRGPLADVLSRWSALSVMGTIIVLAMLSIACLGAADSRSADAELFDVR